MEENKKSKLIFERNELVQNDIIVESLPEIRHYSEWNQDRISEILSEEISYIVANALTTVFNDEGAEKDWNIVWKELILYRDLAIVLFYSRAKLENEKSQIEENIAAKVKIWSSVKKLFFMNYLHRCNSCINIYLNWATLRSVYMKL